MSIFVETGSKGSAPKTTGCAVAAAGPDLRGGGRRPGPQAPHQQRAPTKPLYFISRLIDTHIVVYITYDLCIIDVTS